MIKSGYNVTVTAFIPVDNANPDNVIRAATAVKDAQAGDLAAIQELGIAVSVKSKFVSRRVVDDAASEEAVAEGTDEDDGE